MARLNWNFASRRYPGPPWAAFWLIASFACVHALQWRHDLLQQRDHAIAALDDVSRQLAHHDHTAARPAPSALRAVFSGLHAPWTAMLDSLRRATHPGVELIALEPDGNEVKRFHISGVANRAQDVFELVEALQSDPSWSAVQLVNQTTTREGNIAAGKDMVTLPGLSPAGISFSLLAEWANR